MLAHRIAFLHINAHALCLGLKCLAGNIRTLLLKLALLAQSVVVGLCADLTSFTDIG